LEECTTTAGKKAESRTKKGTLRIQSFSLNQFTGKLHHYLLSIQIINAETVLGTGTKLIEATKVGGMGNTTTAGKKAESKK
jgi:hypothetical protein